MPSVTSLLLHASSFYPSISYNTSSAPRSLIPILLLHHHYGHLHFSPVHCASAMASLRMCTTQLAGPCASECVATMKPKSSVSALSTTSSAGVVCRNARRSSRAGVGRCIGAPGGSPVPPPVTPPQTPQPGPSGIPGPGSPPFPGSTPTPVPSPGPGPTPGSPPGPPTPGGVPGGVPNFPGPGMPL